MSIPRGYTKIKTENRTKKAKGQRRKATKAKAKTPAQRRYWLDIGKAISLELTAAKYDQADAGGDGAQ